MAITTQFIPEYVNTSSFNILKEFIYSHIDPYELDVCGQFPVLDENFVLNRPMLVLEDMNGSKKYVGMGRRTNNGDKGQFKTISFMANLIISNDIGGHERLRQLADFLEYIFLTYSNELSVAGLKKAQCSSMRTIPQETSSPFWGGRMMISARVLISY